MGGAKPHRYWPELAWQQAFRCGLCGFDLPAKIHVHHRYPVNPPAPYPKLPKPLLNDKRNLVVTCPPCNISAYNRIGQDAIDAYTELTGNAPVVIEGDVAA